MDAETLRLARWLEAQPWNRPGTEKGWVLRSMWGGLVFRWHTQRARRVAAR
jgi:hypothetical protein